MPSSVPPIPSSEITPHHVYLTRREFLKTMGLLAGGSLLAGCVVQDMPETASISTPQELPTGSTTDELGDALTSFDAITNYNNYYEFSTDKQEVARLAKDFKTEPWTLTVGGMVSNPKTYSVDDLIRLYGEEERVYRLRCVEGWSMVIPWLGFPLAKLLEDVQPTSSAKFVQFTALLDKEQMPGQKSPWYDWPYTEGLRLDEAMNDLTLLSTGLYGQSLPPQSGAPLRLVVPWKYGFKSIKAVVKIDLVDYKPESLWMKANPSEYGFYSNVNPDVPHPRWSQKTERRIGEAGRRDTLPFNGYAEQVAHMYAGMNLTKANDAGAD